MPEYNFPLTVYDQPSNLLAVLGSWWADAYGSGDQVAAVVQSRSRAENQAMFDVLELISSMSRFTVPIYHTKTWYPLYLRASQRNTAVTNMPKYDDGQSYDAGIHYDVPEVRPHHAFPKPADLINVPLLFNRFVEPTLTQTVDLDYTVTADTVVFRVNPFDDPRVAKRVIYTDGVATDTEAVLWVFHGEFDWDTVYRQFGYAIGMQLSSSIGYRKLLNAVYDALTGGATTTTVTTALSAMTGVPLVREESEVVVDIVSDNTQLLIITDLSVYRYSLNTTPLVAIGDTVTRGQPLTTAFQLFDLNRGVTPADVQALAIGQSFLATCFFSELIFENRNVPIVVETDHPSGYTKVSWGLGGFPLDVEHFFDEMHDRGVIEAQRTVDECDDGNTILYPANDCNEVEVVGRRGTIAHLLDIRTTRVGEPTALQLPTTINPLQFLITNVLRNNAIVVRVQANTLGADSVGLHNLRLLRKVIPPNVALILLIDLTVDDDLVTVDNLEESMTLFLGMSPLTDTVSTISDAQLTIRVVGGSCQ